MDLATLIDVAKENAGSYGAVADRLGKHQNRFSEWKKGVRQPDTGEIATMALIAKLPILQTVAEIESQIHPETAEVWKVALKERGKRSFYGPRRGIEQRTKNRAQRPFFAPGWLKLVYRQVDCRPRSVVYPAQFGLCCA